MKLAPLFTAAALAVVFAVVSTAAHAQATRTWVSGVGDDANPCSRTAPCKTFAGAISKTATGGEISVLDPAGFGGVTIAKAITIDGAAQLSGILAASIAGVIVNTTGAVTLRNLTIQSPRNGLAAIRHISSGPLHAKNVRINMMGTGAAAIDFAPNAATDVTLSDVTITNCTSPASGVRLNGASGAIKATLDGVQVSKCGIGVELLANARVANAPLAVGSAGYTITLANAGPSDAVDAAFNDPLPAGARFASLAQLSGPAANCVTPAVGANGVVSCTVASLGVGTSASFQLVVNGITATSATADPNPDNQSASAEVSVRVPAAVPVPLLPLPALALLIALIALAGLVALDPMFGAGVPVRAGPGKRAGPPRRT